ncbi:MAG: hypothetical protein IKC13_07050, partial [Elusimicrobiaceae bacterium]|nr:hypothetical protein [Elusimicrobiaceae bacterium]
GDITKIEKILTEEGENCGENKKNRKQYSYYSGYIDKIATNIIKLPAPHPYFIRDFFIKNLESIEKEKNIKFLQGNDLGENFPNLNFKNLREAKKILVGFTNSFFQEKVQTEVDPFQFLLVTILSVSFPEVYNKIFQNERFWVTDAYNKNVNTQEETFKEWDNYFSSLYSLYPERGDFLKPIFIILNHAYLTFLYDKEGSSYTNFEILYEKRHKAVSYIQKPLNSKNYFYRYFNHTLSPATIPDKVLDALWNNLKVEHNQDVAVENLQAFLVKNQEGLGSFFSYISFHLQNLDLKSLNYLPFAWKNLINQQNTPFKKGELDSIFEKIKEIVKDKKIPSQTLLEIAFEVNSICYKIYLYHILLQENSEEAKELIGFLQKQNWNAKDVLSDCFYYKQSYYNFAAFYDWLRDFKYPAHYLEKRQADSIVVFKEDELIFWEAIGETLYRSTQGYSMNDTLKTWGKENIFDIIEQLLQQPDLTHRQELQEIKEYYKDWKPHTQDSN